MAVATVQYDPDVEDALKFAYAGIGKDDPANYTDPSIIRNRFDAKSYIDLQNQVLWLTSLQQNIVTVAPENAQFTTIQSAIDSITDASSSKPYHQTDGNSLPQQSALLLSPAPTGTTSKPPGISATFRCCALRLAVWSSTARWQARRHRRAPLNFR